MISDSLPSAKIPSWATIHNIATVENVCIIELHTSGRATPCRSTFMELMDELGTTNSLNYLCVETRWFQGNQPQSISNVLMYSPSRTSEIDNQRLEDHTGDETGIAMGLNKLIASNEDLKNEGYPELHYSDVISHEMKIYLSKLIHEQNVACITPHDVSVNEARNFMEKFGIDVECQHSTGKSHAARFVGSIRQGKKTPDVFAVDCEMVKTSIGLELARVTMIKLTKVSRSGLTESEVVWDAIVKPSCPVIDYLSIYSGMTEEIMSNACYSLNQVQLALSATIAEEDILIGHSLENDLRALRFHHSRVVDTALLFRPTHARFKYSLRTLAAKLLKSQIQLPGQPHCSREDAATALELAVRRMLEGPKFGIHDSTKVNILHKAAASGGVTVCVGPSNWLRQHVTSQPNAIHALGCESANDSNRKAIISWLSGPSRRAKLIWGMIQSRNESDEDSWKGLTNAVVPAIAHQTFLVVLFQPGFEEAQLVSQLRKARRNPKATCRWSDDEENHWRDAVEHCRYGAACWFSRGNLSDKLP